MGQPESSASWHPLDVTISGSATIRNLSSTAAPLFIDRSATYRSQRPLFHRLQLGLARSTLPRSPAIQERALWAGQVIGRIHRWRRDRNGRRRSPRLLPRLPAHAADPYRHWVQVGAGVTGPLLL